MYSHQFYQYFRDIGLYLLLKMTNNAINPKKVFQKYPKKIVCAIVIDYFLINMMGLLECTSYSLINDVMCFLRVFVEIF